MSSIGPFGGWGRDGRGGRTTEIKGWMTRAFGLDEGTTVTVVELRCTEPGCPPVETVVAILGSSDAPQQYKIHKPISEVTFEDVAGLGSRKNPEGGIE